MKKLCGSRIFQLAACLLLCLAGLWVTASAANYSLAGNTLLVYDLAQDVKTVIAAGYDSQGRMLFAETAEVQQNGNGIREGTADLPNQTPASLKLYFVSGSWTPVAEPQPVEQEMATRAWICQQICAFWNVDLSLYDDWDMPFDDCKTLSPPEQLAILAVADAEIMRGYGDGNFGPNDPLTRAQAAKVLCAAVGRSDLPKTAATGYSDVPSDAWFAPYVKELRDKDVLPLTESFHPSNRVSQRDFSQWLNMLTPYKVSNLRFEVQDGLPVLAWDSVKNLVRFRIFANAGYGSWNIANTRNLSMPLVAIGEENWTGFEVRAIDRKTDDILALSGNPSLSVHINYLPPFSVTPTLSVTDMGDYFNVTVGNLGGYDTCSVKYSQDSSGRNHWGNFDRLDGKSTWTFETDAPASYLPPVGYCRIEAGKNYTLSADGNSLTYDTELLWDWSQSLP